MMSELQPWSIRRRILLALTLSTLSLCSPIGSAQDEPKNAPAGNLESQIKQIIKEHQEEQEKFFDAYSKAKTEEEKQKLSFPDQTP